MMNRGNALTSFLKRARIRSSFQTRRKDSPLTSEENMPRIEKEIAKIRVPAVTPTPQSPIGSGFGADSTAAEVIAGRDLMGKTVVVTGGYSGIGIETVR